MATMKDMRGQVETVLKDKITNKEKFFAALPLLTQFQASARIAYQTAKTCLELGRKLSDACAEYALDCQSVFDSGLHNEDGVQVGDVTINDVVYHFASGYDKPKRIDGENLSQAFMDGLPENWRKVKYEIDTTGINRAHVTNEQLAEQGLYRPAKNEWSEKMSY